MLQRGGNRNFRYAPNARNTPDSGVPPPGVMGSMLPAQLEMGGVPVPTVDTGVPQPFPISALASALASAPPEQQRAVSYSFKMCHLWSALMYWMCFQN
jgi:polyadenylate-binding protein